MRSDENESVLPRVHKKHKEKKTSTGKKASNSKNHLELFKNRCAGINWSEERSTAEPDHGKSLITSIQGPLS